MPCGRLSVTRLPICGKSFKPIDILSDAAPWISLTMPPPGNASSSVRLAFVGDMGFTWRLGEAIDAQGIDWFLSPLGNDLRGFDAIVGNLECAVMPTGTQPPPSGRIQTLPCILPALKAMGIDAVTLANNHVLDGGPDGLASTRALLAQHGIAAFGAGADIDQARAPLMMEVGGIKLALLGVCDAPYAYATATRGGVAPLDRRWLLEEVARLRGTGATVIVVLHAGTEFVFHPEPARIRLSRGLIDAGAALVIQHHPHVVQGIERHGDGLIAYSLGNFIFRLSDNRYQRDIAGVHDGYVLAVSLSTLAPHRVETVDLLPTRIDPEDRPALLAGDARLKAQSRLDQLSRDIEDDALIARRYRATCRREVRGGLLDSYYTLRRRGLAEGWARLRTEMMRGDRRRYYLGLIGLNAL